MESMRYSMRAQYAYSELEKVMTGQRPQPTIQEFIAELPAIVWTDEQRDEFWVAASVL